jgi:hypothetical protein
VVGKRKVFFRLLKGILDFIVFEKKVFSYSIKIRFWIFLPPKLIISVRNGQNESLFHFGSKNHRRLWSIFEKKRTQLVVTGDKVYYKLFSSDARSSVYARFPRARLFAISSRNHRYYAKFIRSPKLAEGLGIQLTGKASRTHPKSDRDYSFEFCLSHWYLGLLESNTRILFYSFSTIHFIYHARLTFIIFHID